MYNRVNSYLTLQHRANLSGSEKGDRGLGDGEHLHELQKKFFAKNEFWLPSKQVLSKYTLKDGLETCQDEHHCLQNRDAFYIK